MQTEELIRRKKDLNISNRKIARDADLPLGTVQKIFSGETKNPRYDTMIQLDRVLNYYEDIVAHKQYADTLSARQHTSTVFQQKNIPSRLRQMLRLESAVLFREALIDQSQDEKSTIWLAPCEVELKPELPKIYPDLFISDLIDPDPFCFHGAPELLLEICSLTELPPDFILKLRRYKEVGVRECWIMDLEQWTIIVYRLSKVTKVEEYSFDEAVPFHWNKHRGQIEFGEIAEKICRNFPHLPGGGEICRKYMDTSE